MGNTIPLRFLFTVLYKDGTVYKQGADDTSLTNPLKSAFYDVRLPEVKQFLISDGVDVYSVDLEDGHFEVNEKPFMMHDGALVDFRLVFFRTRDASINVDKKGLLSNPTQRIISYHIGWQARDEKGKNVQRILFVKH